MKKTKIMSGSLAFKEVKKRQVESWADWMLANLRVLSTCPNERLLGEYLEYMVGRVKLQRRGFKWEQFKRFDEAFRRRRWLDGKRWNDFYGDLWCEVTTPVLSHTPTDQSKTSGNKWRGSSYSKGYNTSPPSPSSSAPSGFSPSSRPACKFFNNRGGCRERDNCPDIHRCSMCKNLGHNKFACKDGQQVRS